MSKHKEHISTLLDYAVAEENDKPNIEVLLEISDRINNNKTE